MLVRVRNKTNNTVNLASGPLYGFQEGEATQAEASNMYAVLEWLHDEPTSVKQEEELEPEEEPERRKPGRPKKND